MADYAPLPQHLEHELRTIINAVKKNPTDGPGLVYLISQSLGRAYCDGHQAGRMQADTARYIAAVLDEKTPPQ